ncbi:MAG: hypothetical protein R6W85_02805, partial [Gillisia sp.]
MLKRLKKSLGFYKKIDNVLITPYRSYGTRNHLYVLGRALDDVPLKIVEDQSFFKTIKNTIRQFDTYEIADAKIELEIPDLIKLSAKTSEKGYFLFDKTVPQDLSLAADE